MTKQRIALIAIPAFAFGIVVGVGATTFNFRSGPDQSDPRHLIPDLGSRTEAGYKEHVEFCRKLMVQFPGELKDMPECMMMQGYSVVGRSEPEPDPK